MKCAVCAGEELRTVYESGGARALSCAGCGVVFLHPVPGEDELRKLYGDDYFKVSYLPEDRLRKKKEFYAEQLERAELRARPGRALDVGCGVGTFMDAAAARGWDAWGVDIAEFAVETARKTFGEKVQRGALTDATFPGEVFDLITFWDSLEHIPDPVSALRAARDKLRDGGLLVIKVPNTIKLLFAATRMLKAFGVNAERPLIHLPSHLFHYTKKSMARLLAAAGFEVVEISFVNEKKAQLEEHTYPALNLMKRTFFTVLHLFNYKESLIVHAKKQ